ncbi:MAG TPA: ATP-binding protein [Longimicrobiales bacterium]|nr:ATP-binding protein [Longimicrobiales bacterium]
MKIAWLQARVARWGWVLPAAALTLLLAGTFYLDRQNANQLELARQEAGAAAQREAATLGEELAAQVGSRVGALAAAKLQFTAVEDSVSRRAFAAAVDSVISRVSGLSGISVIYPDPLGAIAPDALRRGRYDPFAIDGVPESYRKAIETRRPAASRVIDTPAGRRFLVFDPVTGDDTLHIRAVLVAEMEPNGILRAALERAQETGSLGPSFYDIYDDHGRRITNVPAPQGWPRVERPVRIADTEWRLVVAHQPVSEQPYEVIRTAIWVTGIVLSLAFALSLTLLWRMVAAQREEIGRRRAAEEQARQSAAEAAWRALQARRLTEQLESAQQMALRLSGSHDPEEVIEEFLGGVGEALEADVAMLYIFEEEDDAVVGRRRILLNPAVPRAEDLLREDFRKVRAPVALMKHLSEPVATGRPFLAKGAELAGTGPGGAGMPGPTALLTIPLTIGGHLVGLAVWETYGEGRLFDADAIPFAQAVTAHAAAILRAAELLESVGQAMEKASKEAVRLATVLDQLSDGVVLFDANGEPELVNAAAEALLGISRGASGPADWDKAFRSRALQKKAGGGEDFFPARALRGERLRDVRFTVRVQGSDRYIAASAAPVLGQDGVIRGAAVVLHDVTDEHEYAEMLRHTNQELRQQAALLERVNDELRAATAAKDQFLAMMSHELRTPINAIIGYTDLLDLGVHGALNESQRTMMSRVLDTSNHLLGLVNDLLDLTKIAAGRIDLRFEEVAVERIVRRAVDQIAPLAAGKDLRVEVKGDSDPVAVADETRLSQILINLASNAVKFTESGSITFEYGVDGDRARICVRDTGPGIGERDREQVFDEFYQVDSGLARNVGGSGLGLAISRRLARLMGGEISLQSEPGRGSEFVLDLPLSRARSTVPRDA